MSLKKIEQLLPAQISQLHQLYQNEWWTKGRTLPDVKIMLQNTDFIFAICEPDSNQLVAFARVLTDKVFKALILDVIVDPDYQGQGLGKEIMKMILDHPELKDVKHFELYCLPELIPFYKKWGFTEDLGKLTALRLCTKNK